MRVSDEVREGWTEPEKALATLTYYASDLRFEVLKLLETAQAGELFQHTPNGEQRLVDVSRLSVASGEVGLRLDLSLRVDACPSPDCAGIMRGASGGGSRCDSPDGCPEWFCY